MGFTGRTEDTILRILRILVTNNFHTMPQNSAEKLLILGWLVYTYVISIAVQSILTSLLSKESYTPEIDTLEALSKEPLQVYGLTRHVLEMKEKYENSEYSSFVENFNQLSIDEGFVPAVIFYYDVKLFSVKFALILDRQFSLFFSRRRTWRIDGRSIFHVMKGSIIRFHEAYHVRNGWIFYPIINKKLKYLREGGFVDKYYTDTFYRAIIRGLLYPDENYESVARHLEPMTLSVGIYGFYLLFIGYIVSFVGFIFEIFLYLVKKIHKYWCKSKATL